MTPFLGQIMLVGFNFAPQGWAFCDGQLLPIAQNTALFSLLGTQYGGNGVNTFALPDLRGRVAMHKGQGPGLSFRSQGEVGGTESVTLLTTQMPAHAHTLFGTGEPGSSQSPSGLLAAETSEDSYAAGALAAMSASAIGQAGGNQPHPNMQPYLVMNYIIALQGIYPSPS